MGKNKDLDKNKGKKFDINELIKTKKINGVPVDKIEMMMRPQGLIGLEHSEK